MQVQAAQQASDLDLTHHDHRIVLRIRIQHRTHQVDNAVHRSAQLDTMMEAELAKELREATDQLLDIAPAPSSAFPASPHLRQGRQAPPPKPLPVIDPQPPTFSAHSKLEVLHSPTDVRPFQWPVPTSTASSANARDTASPSVAAVERSEQPIRIELSRSLLDDGDDNLPAKGLSSRARSVKAGTGEEHDEASALTNNDHEQEARAASPSKLRIRTPVNDIYINEYGERVVQGKVVGRILGGRPRPGSSNGASLQAPNNSRIDPVSATSSPNISSTLTATNSTNADSTSVNATSPPAFFLESFPNAFEPAARSSPPASSPPSNREERRTSRGGPPKILKAPRAVAGALTLAHSDNVDDLPLLPDTSFQTASDLGSPSSVTSTQLSLSPKPQKRRPLSSSPSRISHVGVGLGLGRLKLHSPIQFMSPQKEKEPELLLPGNRALSSDSTRPKLELPALRRPTPTIELSQAKADPVVLHGNKRQARASGVASPQDEASVDGASIYASPAVSPPTPSASSFVTQTNAQDDPFGPTTQPRARLESASEPTSPLLSPRRTRTEQGDANDYFSSAQQAQKDDNADDNASLNSAPSSLISLPVSTLTSSSRSSSHRSLERRRSSPSHRRTSSHRDTAPDIFAREIRIRGWSEVGSQARGWVVFELRIITKQGTPIIAHKRFSSFVKLRSALKTECRDQAKWLPELPTRRTGLLSKYDAKYLEKRRRALQRWLEVVALDRVWGASEAWREWVLASE